MSSFFFLKYLVDNKEDAAFLDVAELVVYRGPPNILMDGDRLIYALTRGGMLYPWSRMALLRIL